MVLAREKGMLDANEILATLDGVAFAKQYVPDTTGPDQSGEMRFRCPFHDDTNPSASFNVETKLFRCWSCGASGSAIDLLARITEKPRHVAAEWLARQAGVAPKKAINPQLMEEWHRALRVNAGLLDELERRQGIDIASVERWRLGWMADKRRLTIPIRDPEGYVVNVRQYDLLKVHDAKKKYLNVKGHGQLRLWPLEALEGADEIIITEGELKVIALVQRGFERSITTTGGAHGWNDAWNQLFLNKRVILVYDSDATGRSRARAIARRLYELCKEIKIVQLPLDRERYPHGDVNDYFCKERYSAQDFMNLVLGTAAWQPEQEQPVSPGLRDDLTYEVDLDSSSKSQYYLRRLQINVIVSAKDTAPYIAPREVQVDCPKNMDICQGCPVFLYSQRMARESGDEHPTWALEADDPNLLSLINVSIRNQERAVRRMIGIPEKCDVHEIINIESHNIEEVRLVPELPHVDTSGKSDQTVTRAYYVGHGIDTNASYQAKARSVVHPNDQHATLLVYEATPNVDSLSEFSPSERELQDMVLFQPLEASVSGLNAKLNDIYADLEANVTHIHERRDLHAIMDLAWHSPLYVSPFGEAVKGWLDVLVLGDSGQGKSETALRLQRHYQMGERVDMKGASVAGLKGGLQDTQGRWFVTWGVIPLNDRKLVVLEEVKGASPSLLQTLTEMRSSGVAELTKIERRRARARTRLIWISNPRSDRPVDTYGFGVVAIKELMGSLEDVRRFDAALIVSSHEVSAEVISRSVTKTAKHEHTSELCKRLILWAWSRRPDQIVFDAAAKDACLRLAVEHSERYSAAIPLVEPADHRYKLARMSAALAARTFSCDETGQRLLVGAHHVEWIGEFLDRIYGSQYSGYASFSEIQKVDASLVGAESLRDLLFKTPFPVETIRGLMRTNEIRSVDVEDWAGVDRDTARDLVAILVRQNALRRGRQGYYKTGAFIEFLKSLKANGSIPAHIAEDLDF